jgi:transcription-repair coupling factor (superfamily II helicase)
VSDLGQRLSIYRRLARMNELKEISDIKDELTDRYGPLPEPAQNLLIKIMLRIIAIKAGVKRLDLGEERMVVAFSELHQKRPLGILELIDRFPQRYQPSPQETLTVKMSANTAPRLMADAKNALLEIAKHVNN